LNFWKMNGAGNDFIILDNMDGTIPRERHPFLAKTLCERHLSVGADGLMVVEKPTGEGDYRMLFYNSDGSMGEMCGNGARCICRYGYETGLSGAVQRVETTAGLVTGYRMDAGNYRIRLNDPRNISLNLRAEALGEIYTLSYIELGDPGIPHAVVAYPRLRETPPEKLFALGEALRHHPLFPKGANVNFYDVLGADHVFLRTFERGVEDFTYACGTGTGATATVLFLLGLAGTHLTAEMRGGTLLTGIDAENKNVRNLWLTGPTNIVAKGEITDSNIEN